MITTGEAVGALHWRAAEQEAERCAAKATVRIRELDSAEEMLAAAEVLRSIWRTEADQSLVHPSMLVALAHGGNYVAGAFRGERMVAVCVGFFSVPPGPAAGSAPALHSHIAGVLGDCAGQGVGTALKMHQRLWCLRRGVPTITWTFDPLVARNASFNLHRLGVTARSYLTDFYGAMTDGVNNGQSTDRLLVGWDLARPPVDAAADAAVADRAASAVALATDGSPVEAPDGIAAFAAARTFGRIAIPDDIESIRRLSPDTAGRWRDVTRRWLTGLLGVGWSVVGFDRGAGYLLTSHQADR